MPFHVQGRILLKTGKSVQHEMCQQPDSVWLKHLQTKGVMERACMWGKKPDPATCVHDAPRTSGSSARRVQPAHPRGIHSPSPPPGLF